MAPPADDAETPGAGSLEILLQHGGRPVPGAVVHLQPVRRGDELLIHQHSGLRGSWVRVTPTNPLPRQEDRRSLTDGAGRASMQGIAAGRWLVHALGETHLARIAPEKILRAHVDIDPEKSLRTVHGRAVDSSGTPVPGATVWACREHIDPLRSRIAHTDAGGYFDITVLPFTTIGVQHPAHGPVGRSIGPNDPAEQRVEFRLGPHHAALRGTVRDPEGHPIPNAVVQLGHSTDALTPRFVAAVRPIPRPRQVVTDRDGRFEAEGLLPGSLWIGARATGHGSIQRMHELRVGEPARLDIELPGACTVRGKITSESGAPLAGVLVRCGHPGDFQERSTSTDEDGRYELTDVPTDGARLQAVDFHGGFACLVLRGEAGSTVQWDPQLGAHDLEISGRVVQADGTPLAGRWLARNTDWKQEVVRLDAEGRFRIRVSERQTHAPTTLGIYEHDPRGTLGKLVGVPLLVERGVPCGSRDLVFRVPAAPSARGWFRGRVLDADGRPPATPVFLIHRGLDSFWRTRLDPLDADGGFDGEGVPAGDYEVFVAGSNGRPFGPFAVIPGQTNDLGTLKLGPEPTPTPGAARHACRLVLSHPLARTGAGQVRVRVEDRDGQTVYEHLAGWHESGHSSCATTLPAGDYTVFAEAADGARGSAKISVDDAAPPRRPFRIALRRSPPSDAPEGR